MLKHIGFTGTSQGMSLPQRIEIQRMFANIPGMYPEMEVIFHHGDCVGADEEAHHIALVNGMKIHLHPPENSKSRAFCTPNWTAEEKPYLERNKDIVRASSLMFATPKEYEEVLRSGTWSTVRFARKIGVRVCIVLPDGSRKIEGNKNV